MFKGLTKYLFLGLVLVLILAAYATSAPAVEKPEDFYKGKTINFIAPYGPGAGTDLWVRALAPHMKKHTGAYAVVVVNMEGGGGLLGGSYLYNTAKPDGLTISIIPSEGMLLAEVLGLKEAKYEMDKFTFIGRTYIMTKALLVSKASGWKTVEDMKKAAKVRFGVVDPTSAAGVEASAVSEALGLKSTIVSGYKSAKDVRLVLIAGREIDARSSAISTEEIKAIKEGEYTLIASLGRERLQAFPEVPTLLEMPGLTAESKKWLEFIANLNRLGRVVAAPPDVPKDRAAFIEKSLMASFKEPAFIEWVNKMAYDFDPLSAEETKALITNLMRIIPLAERPKAKEVLMKKYY